MRVARSSPEGTAELRAEESLRISRPCGTLPDRTRATGWTGIYRENSVAAMNKLMAILFALGAIGFFGMSQRDSYQAQDQTRYGTPVGEVRTVQITRGHRIGYIVFGAASTAGFLYFLSRIRRNDLRS
jgi:hypothetical protein